MRNWRKTLKREGIVFLVLLLCGLLLVPVTIYFAGNAVFGNYQTYDGIGSFLRRFFAGLTQGDGPLWFIVLSPWLAIQCLRLGLKFAKPAVATAKP